MGNINLVLNLLLLMLFPIVLLINNNNQCFSEGKKDYLVFMIEIHNINSSKWANTLLNKIYNKEDYFLIHIDKNQYQNETLHSFETIFKYANNSNVHKISLLSNEYMTITQVKLSMGLLQYSVENFGKGWTHALLLSGDSYPLYSLSEIRNIFIQNKGRNFMNIRRGPFYQKRFMGNHNEGAFTLLRFDDIWVGNSWWGISRQFAYYLVNEDFPKQVINYGKDSCCPDEAVYQTILKNSKFSGSEILDPCYMWTDWRPGDRSANTIDGRDRTIKEVFRKRCLFARKVRNEEIAYAIDQIIYYENFKV